MRFIIFYRFHVIKNGRDKLHSFAYTLLNIPLVSSNIFYEQLECREREQYASKLLLGYTILLGGVESLLFVSYSKY